jgi:hypothetical protein
MMMSNLALRRVIPTKARAFSFSFRAMSSKPVWATAYPELMGTTPEPYAVSNLVGGKWVKANSEMLIPHPLDKNKHPIFSVPDTDISELAPFFESLRKVTKSGVHNPLKNVSVVITNWPVFLSFLDSNAKLA